MHENNQGVTGVGLTSGDRYSIQQNAKIRIVESGPTLDHYQDVRLRLVRHGSADDLWIRETLRITSHVEIIRFEIECRG
jgi:hypothetical protein